MGALSRLLLGIASLVLACWAVPAQAQQVLICYGVAGQGPCQAVTATTPLPVSASVTASVTGFRPTSTGTPISVTTGGVTGSLPSNTGEVVATNVGTTNGAYCKLGASATTSDQYIAPNGGWFGFAISGDTQLTCITSTSTTTVNMVGGSGLPTGTGGGGGGSGGGGAITAASGSYSSGALSSGSVASGAFASGALASGAGTDGWDPEVGITTAVAASVGGAGSVNAKLRLMTSQLDTINTNIIAGTGTTGSGVPASAIYMGVNVGGNLVGVAPGIAGTPSTQVASIQGASGMTPVAVNGAVNVTPTDCSGTVTSGGTAQNAISAAATIHGYEIVNIDTTAECLNISKTGTAAANTAGSACLAPATSTTTGGSYNTPLGAGFNTNLSVIAATTGHKFTCTRW